MFSPPEIGARHIKSLDDKQDQNYNQAYLAVLQQCLNGLGQTRLHSVHPDLHPLVEAF